MSNLIIWKIMFSSLFKFQDFNIDLPVILSKAMPFYGRL